MYASQFDEETQIFRATLSEAVEITELAQSLRECFDTNFKNEIKALWEISEMRVAFGLDDVEQLAEVMKLRDAHQGKFAFVVGQQQFLQGVVESVRSLRNDWSTCWQVFDATEDALEWLSS